LLKVNVFFFVAHTAVLSLAKSFSIKPVSILPAAKSALFTIFFLKVYGCGYAAYKELV